MTKIVAYTLCGLITAAGLLVAAGTAIILHHVDYNPPKEYR